MPVEQCSSTVIPRKNARQRERELPSTIVPEKYRIPVTMPPFHPYVPEKSSMARSYENVGRQGTSWCANVGEEEDYKKVEI